MRLLTLAEHLIEHGKSKLLKPKLQKYVRETSLQAETCCFCLLEPQFQYKKNKNSCPHSTEMGHGCSSKPPEKMDPEISDLVRRAADAILAGRIRHLVSLGHVPGLYAMPFN